MNEIWWICNDIPQEFRNTWGHDHIATTVFWKMLLIALRKYVFLWSIYLLQIEPHVHTKHLQGRIKVRKLQPMDDGCFSRYNNALLQLSPGFSLSPSANISLLQQVLYKAPHSTKLWHYHVFLEVFLGCFSEQGKVTPVHHVFKLFLSSCDKPLRDCYRI